MLVKILVYGKTQTTTTKNYCPFVWPCKLYINVMLWSVAISENKIISGLVI